MTTCPAWWSMPCVQFFPAAGHLSPPAYFIAPTSPPPQPTSMTQLPFLCDLPQPPYLPMTWSPTSTPNHVMLLCLSFMRFLPDNSTPAMCLPQFLSFSFYPQFTPQALPFFQLLAIASPFLQLCTPE